MSCIDMLFTVKIKGRKFSRAVATDIGRTDTILLLSYICVLLFTKLTTGGLGQQSLFMIAKWIITFASSDWYLGTFRLTKITNHLCFNLAIINIPIIG